MRISTTSTKRTNRAAALAAALLCCASASLAGDGSARALIEETVVRVIAVLKDSERSTTERRQELEKIAHERFDFRTMARLVLGRNWRRLAEPQRDEFVAEFTTYLANDYGTRVDGYEQEEAEVLAEEPKPRGDVVVKTRIVGGRNDGVMIDYRMRQNGDEWRIIDVVIEGISLVSNFRDQFSEVISRSGPEGLLAKLREKNAGA